MARIYNKGTKLGPFWQMFTDFGCQVIKPVLNGSFYRQAVLSSDSQQIGMKKKMKRFAKYHLPIILYIIVIFALSSISNLALPDTDIDYIDKLAHFIEYLIFFFLSVISLNNAPISIRKTTSYLLAIFLSFAFAASDEFHQSFIPGRFADGYDLLADSLGILAGASACFLTALAKKRYPGRKS